MIMASSSTNTSQSKKYDAFISFRGADIRSGFLSHLHKALHQNQINAFLDENLERGKEISSSLLETIQDSLVSIVIFSENYADSPWCLDELVQIVECKESMGQIVLPVFYQVNPTHVQELTGSFGDALCRHKQEFNHCLDKVKSWSHALIEIANLSGWDSRNVKTESKLVEEIVNDVLEKLSHMHSSDSHDECLIGIDSRVKEVESLLCIGSRDVCSVGIWGMGGVGKTTIAGAIFNRIFTQFEGHCFVANVREELEKRPPVRLRDEILSQLLGIENLNVGTLDTLPIFIRNKLRRKKVLIVLDDVSSSRQLKSLLGEHDSYGPGSRVIITSRDKQVLMNGCSKIYVVRELNYHEALMLFKLHAFKQNCTTKAQMELSNKVVSYAKGIPLALIVLGCNLYNKEMEEWESELAKLEGIPNMEIQKILRISYDGLDDNEKSIFLDIACFFKGEGIDRVINILDVCDFFAKSGIGHLKDKSLITISNNTIQMHDLLQQMGKNIVCEEKDIGKRSRLWNPEDIYYVLAKDMGTEKVEGIILRMCKIRYFELCSTVFRKMHSLRFLKFYDLWDTKQMHLLNGLEFLPDGLNFLHWEGYSSQSLPLNFYPKNLVELHMCWSQLKQLWNVDKPLENLKIINLSYSVDLVRIPNLSKVPNLEILDLKGCIGLVEISSSLECLSKLTRLDLGGCKSLCRLPSCLHVKSLEFLSLQGCSKITKFLDLKAPNLEVLDLKGCTGLVELPLSLQYLSKLAQLNLEECSGLCRLPSCLPLKSLEFLSFKGCSRLTIFPVVPWNITELSVSGTAIKQVPSSVGCLSQLRKLELESCIWLERLPSSIDELKCLQKLNLEGCSKLASLPGNICNLRSLRELHLTDCVNLNGLPENLGNLESLERLYAAKSGIRNLPSSMNQLGQLYYLDCSGCKGLILPPLTGLPRLGVFILRNCEMLEFPNSLCSLTSLGELYLCGNNFERIPPSIKQLSNLQRLFLSDCKRLQFLPEPPSALEYLHATNCTSLESASSPLLILEEDCRTTLDFGNCINLDHEARSNIMDHVLAAHLFNHNQMDYVNDVRLYIAGCEVPQMMRHQNKTGSSLSFRLRQHDLIGLSLCAVISSKDYPQAFFGVGCTAHFVDKYGHSRDFNLYCLDDPYEEMNVQSKTTFLWRASIFLDSEDHFIEAFFHFFTEYYCKDADGEDNRYPKSEEVIIMCGVHPIYQDEKDERDEEEQPLQRWKESQELKCLDLNLSLSFLFTLIICLATSKQTKPHPTHIIFTLILISVCLKLLSFNSSLSLNGFAFSL